MEEKICAGFFQNNQCYDIWCVLSTEWNRLLDKLLHVLYGFISVPAEWSEMCVGVSIPPVTAAGWAALKSVS
jgi:hypothetical protein